MDENKNAPKHERKTLWQFIKFLLVSAGSPAYFRSFW